MSRRREAVRKALEWIEREQAVEHYEPLPADPEHHAGRPWIDDWQTAWAETTLSVINNVWHDAGARMYRSEGLLYDDLGSWLPLQAQLIANKYQPRWNHPDPERRWGSYLWKTLRAQARWHFGSYVNGRRGSAQFDEQSDMDNRDSRIEAMIARATPAAAQRFEASISPIAAWRPLDPERYVLLTEAITERIDEGARYDAGDTTLCSWDECTKLASRTTPGGYCEYHRRKTKELWDEGDRCSTPDCPDRASRRGLCSKHYTRESARLARAGLRWDGTRRPPCSEPGCDGTAFTRGLCNKHYLRARAAEKETA